MQTLIDRRVLFQLKCSVVLEQYSQPVRLKANHQFYNLLLYDCALEVATIKDGKPLFQLPLDKLEQVLMQMAYAGKCSLVFQSANLFISNSNQSSLKLLAQKLQKKLPSSKEIPPRKDPLPALDQEPRKVKRQEPRQERRRRQGDSQGAENVKRRRQAPSATDQTYVRKRILAPQPRAIAVQPKKASLQYQLVRDVTQYCWKLILRFAGRRAMALQLVSRHFRQRMGQLVGGVSFHSQVPNSVFNRLAAKYPVVRVGAGLNITSISWQRNWREVDLSDFKNLCDKHLAIAYSWLQRLVLPYYSKLTMQSLKVIPRSLQTLKLSAGNITHRNFQFKDYLLAQAINHHPYLIRISLVWQGQQFLSSLKPQSYSRLLKLKIAVLEAEADDWWKCLQQFTQLEHLAIGKVLLRGTEQIDKVPMFKVGSQVKKLKVGAFMKERFLAQLFPVSYLRLAGRHFLNQSIVLLNFSPAVLDVRDCMNVTPDVIPHLSKPISLRVGWDRDQMIAAKGLCRGRPFIKVFNG